MTHIALVYFPESCCGPYGLSRLLPGSTSHYNKERDGERTGECAGLWGWDCSQTACQPCQSDVAGELSCQRGGLPPTQHQHQLTLHAICAQTKSTDAESTNSKQEIYLGFAKGDYAPREGRTGRTIIDDGTKYPERNEYTGGWAGGETGLKQFIEVRAGGRRGALQCRSRQGGRRSAGGRRAGLAGASAVDACFTRACNSVG